MGSPLSTEEEITAQLRDSEARMLVTLGAHREMMRRVCVGTAVEQVVLSDVREYLPLGRRIRLASLLGTPPLATGPQGEESYTTPPADSPLPPGEVGQGMRSSVSGPPPRETAFQDMLRGASSDPLPAIVTSHDLALLQYTSGTTDEPKAVMLSHGNLFVNVLQTRHWIADARRGSEVILCVLPLSHSYGITVGLNLAIALAGSLVLLPTTRTREILNAVKRYSPTLFPGVPAMYVAVANFPKVRRYGVASIRVCVSGSAPLPVEVQEAFEKLTRGRLVEGYGLTEASPCTHFNPLQGERRVGSIGIPLPGTDARIVDMNSEEPLPPGEVGELLVRGRQVMRGYWKHPTETAEALVDGWLHTGDLARMDEDGFFTIVDRKKDVILAGPYNIYPRDVEEVLYEHPNVREAVVVGVSGTDGAGPIVKAIVVLKRGQRATAEELLALCRERLDAYKVPRIIEFRTELPKNLVGKVLRRLLVEAR
jgi:long-chain acyl-CoA synthetase